MPKHFSARQTCVSLFPLPPAIHTQMLYELSGVCCFIIITIIIIIVVVVVVVVVV